MNKNVVNLPRNDHACWKPVSNKAVLWGSITGAIGYIVDMDFGLRGPAVVEKYAPSMGGLIVFIYWWESLCIHGGKESFVDILGHNVCEGHTWLC